MADTTNCTVYVGNLDDKVNDRVLYDILIQAGPVLDLYLPKDKETDKRKGYAFAQYETEKIAGYAVRLFSDLVTLYDKNLKFSISGQHKAPASSHSMSSSHRPRSSSSSHKEEMVKSKKRPLPSRFSDKHYEHSNGKDYEHGKNTHLSRFNSRSSDKSTPFKRRRITESRLGRY